MGKLVGLGAALFSLASLAAGADGSWSWCSQTSRLKPDPAGRSLYVATWGNDPGWCPGAGYTFRTIAAAARCAVGRDTILVYGGNYGRVQLNNLWPSARVLITNVDGQNPVIDGWNSIADYGAVFGLWRTSNFAVQVGSSSRTRVSPTPSTADTASRSANRARRRSTTTPFATRPVTG